MHGRGAVEADQGRDASVGWGVVGRGAALGSRLALGALTALALGGPLQLPAARQAPPASPDGRPVLPTLARAAPISLRLRPRVGDTLRLKFEQVVQVVPRGGPDAGARARPEDSARRRRATVSSLLGVLSRAIVEQSDAQGSVILAVTDSVVLRMAGAPEETLARTRRAMQGRRTRLRVAPDGATEWMRTSGSAEASGRADSGAGAALAGLRMPGSLPLAPVPLGATWTREMPLPWQGSLAGAGIARLPVTFRLDSLEHGGTLAYVSLRGALPEARAADSASGAPRAGVTRASTSGQILVDLARGWIVDSRSTIVVDVVKAPGTNAPPTRIVVTQRLRAY